VGGVPGGRKRRSVVPGLTRMEPTWLDGENLGWKGGWNQRRGGGGGPLGGRKGGLWEKRAKKYGQFQEKPCSANIPFMLVPANGFWGGNLHFRGGRGNYGTNE